MNWGNCPWQRKSAICSTNSWPHDMRRAACCSPRIDWSMNGIASSATRSSRARSWIASYTTASSSRFETRATACAKNDRRAWFPTRRRLAPSGPMKVKVSMPVPESPSRKHQALEAMRSPRVMKKSLVATLHPTFPWRYLTPSKTVKKICPLTPTFTPQSGDHDPGRQLPAA